MINSYETLCEHYATPGHTTFSITKTRMTDVQISDVEATIAALIESPELFVI
jgi:hypothetical protein